MRARHWIAYAFAAAIITVELPLSEFVALQKLSEDELRDRFDLPDACRPLMSAVRGVRTLVVVFVTCLDDQAGPAAGQRRDEGP
jgi:hypothetical protein